VVHRRRLTGLGIGHLSADMCQGALPAMLPFLAAERGYSYAALGSLILASSIGSSVIQPLFGIASDRIARPWLAPAGVLVAGIGVAAVGIAPSYPLTVVAVVIGGLGVAAFHPEAARLVGSFSHAAPGRAMGLFSFGGNAGWALGPLLTTALLLAFGMPGTLGLAIIPAVTALALARELRQLLGLRGDERPELAEGPWRGPEQPGAFARLGAAVALRSGVYFGLQAFAPAYFVAELGTSKAAGNTALTAMLVAGAAGTLVGGLLADKVGPRVVLTVSLAALAPLVALLPLPGSPVLAGLTLTLIGFVAVATFSVTVVLGQQYLPAHPGLASGVTLGLSIGIGGCLAAVLGVAADAFGLETTMWIIAALPVPALALALTLPTRRGPRAEVAGHPV
jgi:MFS transporter, FSR family, fosmidomycin resistance protein